MGQEQAKCKPRPDQITSIAQLEELRKSVKGSICTPTDETYDENRKCWNWDATGWPSAIVTVSGVDDIKTVVSFAKKHKLDLCIAGGRHSHLCMVNNALVLDMSKMKKIDVDVEKKTAVIQAGVKLGEMDAALEKYGLVVPAGHNPDTGVAGLTLGGGVGYLVRCFGMTIDNLLEVNLVTAEGELITANKDSHEDLFWALRGGGGNFGVVVDFKYQAHSIPKEVLAGSLVFLNVPMLTGTLLDDPLPIAKKVRDYYATMPNEVGAIMVMPFGGPLVTVWVYVGTPEEGTKEFGKFNFSSPINTLKPMPFQSGVQRLVEKEQSPAFYWEKGVLIKELTDEIIELIWKLSHEVPSGVQGVIVVNPIGGKMAEVPVEATAFEQRDALYWILILGKYEKYEMKDATVDYIRKCSTALAPYASGSYAPVINVPEGTDFESDAGQQCFAKNADRLCSIKQKYDPENVFHMNRNISKK